MKTLFPTLFLSLIILQSCVNDYLPNETQKHGFITTLTGRQIPIDSLDQFITSTMDSLKIPGISIAIINNNQIAYHRAFGVKDHENKTPVTDSTIFEGASLSKPLFAYFIMKMVELGKIELDKPIYPFLEKIMPQGAIEDSSLAYYKTLTPRIILSHGSGISNWAHGKPIHIAFKPGTGFSYSGEAYQHLGAALGTKLGIGWGGKLDSLFLNQVAHPLGMYSTFYTWNDKLEQYKANGHQSGKVNHEIHRDKKVGPGYSLHSEAHDYALFLIEMMNPKNLKKELIAEMLKEQNQFKPDNELLEHGQTGWGLGFCRRPTSQGMRYMHTGNNHDFQAYCGFYPGKKYGLVFFMNCDKIEPFIEVLGQFMDDQF